MDADSLAMGNAAFEDFKAEGDRLNKRMDDLLARLQTASETERTSPSFRSEYLEIVRLQGELRWRMLAAGKALDAMPTKPTT